jgi:hypothetical protein
MIVEMRTYTLKPGTRATAAAAFEKLLPECKRIGMKVAGPWLSVEDETKLFWMRGFPDASARSTMSMQFYGGNAWKNELSGIFMPILEKHEVTAVEMPESAVAWL